MLVKLPVIVENVKEVILRHSELEDPTSVDFTEEDFMGSTVVDLNFITSWYSTSIMYNDTMIEGVILIDSREHVKFPVIIMDNEEFIKVYEELMKTEIKSYA